MTVRFVTLSLTAVATRAGQSDVIAAWRHLAALALLIIEPIEVGWQVSLRSAAIGAGDGEHRLLAWATDALPDSGTVIGWRLVDDIVTPLLDAARDADPTLARVFLDRFAPLVNGPTVDLALEHGGAAAPTLAAVMAAHGIPLAAMSAAEIETAWAFGDTDRLQRHAGAQAIDAFRLWLAGAPVDEFPARAAFTRWLAGEDAAAGSEDDR